MNLICAAQFFGFGPSSNLFLTLKYLKNKNPNIRVTLLRNEATEIFYNKNPDVVNYLVDRADTTKANLAISAYDPFLILDAWLHDIPTVFHCNPFWFWDVFNNRKDLIAIKNKLLGYKKNKHFDKAKRLLENISTQNPHHAIFMGYLLADKSFARKFPLANIFVNIFKDEMNIELCNIFLPKLISPATLVTKKNILIQLAGGRNPIMSMEENKIYVLFCLKLTYLLAKKFSDLHFIICANPNILSNITYNHCDKLSNVTIITSVSQEDNLRLMAESLLLFTSPGSETIYEGLYAGCPVFLLPEQNIAQFPFAKLLKKSGYNPPSFLLEEQFPNRARYNGEEDAHIFYGLIQDYLLTDSRKFQCLLNNAMDFIKEMRSAAKRKKYINQAINCIKNYTGKNAFTHIDAVSEYVLENFPQL